MKRVLLLLSPGFEEIEAISPWDLLRRAGIEVISASTGPELMVEGSHGIVIQADRMFDDCLNLAVDMVYLPGGPGVAGLRKDARVLALVRKAYLSGIPLAAICAAPLVLADAEVLESHKVTSFPAVESELRPAIKGYSQARVIVDGKILTSRGAGTSEEFSLTLIEYLSGRAQAEEIREKILARCGD